jgi:ABC-type uncharacterized transport system permease subunit
MRKYVGASLVVLGFILTAFGLESSESMNSRISRVFTTWPVDEPARLLMGGVLFVMIGLAVAVHRRRREQA